jgi:hypothetical protein
MPVWGTNRNTNGIEEENWGNNRLWDSGYCWIWTFMGIIGEMAYSVRLSLSIGSHAISIPNPSPNEGET